MRRWSGYRSARAIREDEEALARRHRPDPTSTVCDRCGALTKHEGRPCLYAQIALEPYGVTHPGAANKERTMEAASEAEAKDRLHKARTTLLSAELAHTEARLGAVRAACSDVDAERALLPDLLELVKAARRAATDAFERLNGAMKDAADAGVIR